MWPAAVFLVGYSGFAAAELPEGPPLAVDGVARLLRYLIEGGAWWWAAGRADLLSGQRRALRRLVAITGLSVALLALDVAVSAGVVVGAEPVLFVLAALAFLLAGATLLAYPQVPLRRGRRLLVGLDLVLVLGPVIVVQWVALRTTNASASPHFGVMLAYSVAQLAMLVGLSVMGTVGQPGPSRRAFWWLVSGLATYLPMTMLAQLHATYGFVWAKQAEFVVYFGGVLQTLVAAVLLRSDPITTSPARPTLERVFGLSPIALLAPVLLGGVLVAAAVRGADVVVPLAIALVVALVVLALRLALTAYENAALLQREHEAEARLQAQKEQVRNEERARLLADVHDGFGSQLVSARLRAERGDMDGPALTALLGECLTDLALVVDTLKAPDLATALSDYRHRLGRRLDGVDCDVHWSVAVDDIGVLGGSVVLQVLRVVQESLNNALKYGEAKNLWIDVRRDADSALRVEVADDGVGVPDEAPLAAGKGLKTMSTRARSIGATLTVGRRTPRGTTVVLRVPLDEASPASSWSPS